MLTCYSFLKGSGLAGVLIFVVKNVDSERCINMNIKQKVNNLRHNKSLMNGALFSMFSFINQGFSFLLLLVLANFITPPEYGYLNLFTTTTMVMSYFMSMSCEGYMSISYFKESKEKVKETFSCILFTALIMFIFFSSIITIGGEALANALNLPVKILFIGVLIRLLTVFSNVNLDYFRLKENVKRYGLLSCGNALLNLCLSIIFVKSCLMGWEGRVWAQLLCYVSFGGYGLYYFIKRKFIVKPSWNHWKMMLLWGIPLIPHLATSFLRQGCDRYIINYSHTIADVGLFSFALNLANIISMVGYGFNQSNSVDIYKTLGDSNISSKQKKEKITKKRHFFMAFYTLSSFLIFLVCYFILPIVLPKYSNSLQYFPLLSVYGFLICMYLVYTNYLFFYKKTKNIMYITFGSSAVHLLLSLLLTRYSLYYTASIYVLTQLGVVLFIRKMAKDTLNKEFKDEEI